jgi:hypothetical protein
MKWKVVGIGALVIAFWANVVLLKVVLNDHYALTDRARDANVAPKPPEAPATACKSCGCREELRNDDVDLSHDEIFVAGPLSKTALVVGLNAVRPRVHACYEKHGVPGTAMVNVVIGKSGRVTSATVTGMFAGTPTGACVEQAVKTAHVPPSDGISVPYPFQLR